MVSTRKVKESYLAKNLFYLRKMKGVTLEEMAEMLSLSGKSSYKAYEENRALPDIHKLMRLASFFDVAVADMVYQDLENQKDKNKSVERKLFEVAKIPVAAAAGYARSFGDSNYIKELDTIKIPFEPYGIARAFDVDGDSMEPVIGNGSTVIGIKIGSSEIKDNKSYIIVTIDGVQCKNIRIDKASEFIYLLSKNEKYLPNHVRKEDVLEIWEVWKIL